MIKENISYQILAEIREQLLLVYGDRLEDVILYGSAAVGQMTEDSDIDIIILLKGPVHLLHDLETALYALLPLSQKYNHPISPKPVNARQYKTMDVPLFSRTRREGLRLA
ncbi:MAG: nucleotidyltransferase domain-containing protein [Verrucomicrobia bacterium]|nr:nucleotidyltransferase domain-containing protein [Verrucomicrobiota bacterium]MBU4248033.1 nucleotidyltransferase domain-containing protein [Verrucomicrobiota bacterium]MBU4289529.1 nucleotidyltransferase domain-containing protein [Verrucomicrobiota bacterium]MBU4496514.1 nucleotidyltransferase domain-containing protein [Verrucomicrobiota bacterium]MCG2678527.1 nucleotidyltransferase domain-containing protein [Kiritimatiellia bacterium]